MNDEDAYDRDYLIIKPEPTDEDDEAAWYESQRWIREVKIS